MLVWLLCGFSHFVECDHCLIIHGSGQEETLVNAHKLISFPRIGSVELFVSKNLFINEPTVLLLRDAITLHVTHSNVPIKVVYCFLYYVLLVRFLNPLSRVSAMIGY